MARALECPACGARHRLDALSGGATFRCDRCGQMLKVPTSIGSTRPPTARPDAPTPAAPTAPTAPTSRTAPTAPTKRAGDGSTAPAPPPRRGGSAAARGQTVSATAGATAAAPVVSSVALPTSDDGAAANGRSRRAPSAPRKKVRLYWRIVAWVVAVPVGFVITAWPAYQLGLLKKDDLLDVFVGEGSGRYVRLLVGAAIWALVTAILVQLFVEGGRWFANRRRRNKARNQRDGSPRQPKPVAGSSARPTSRAESA